MRAEFEKLVACVEKHRELILKTERYLWKNPEIGYKEWKTTEYLVGEFEKLGYTVTRPDNITGLIADLDTGREGPKFAILGELDSLMCETHPEADPETKAVHACGHHCQTTVLLACAAALSEPGALDGMWGSVRFVAVPAEETIDMEFRADLIRKGIIHYNAGKVEYLYRGYFDDVDMAAMVHAHTDTEDYLFNIIRGSDGCINKHFEFEGRAAHAGVEPWNGVNALYAANVGMTAVNALRETFRDGEYNRFHPIVTQGGVAANAIPDTVKMDSYVRGASYESMVGLNKRVNRALSASAAALGANVKIEDRPGNMPLHCDGQLIRHFEEITAELFGEHKIFYTEWSCGSTDMGDISSLMPCIHPEATGATGNLHGSDYRVVDPERACINPAKALVCLLYVLLSDEAKEAKRIIAEYKPVFQTKEAYFEAVNQIELSAHTVEYLPNGDVRLHFQKESERRTAR